MEYISKKVAAYGQFVLVFLSFNLKCLVHSNRRQMNIYCETCSVRIAREYMELELALGL